MIDTVWRLSSSDNPPVTSEKKTRNERSSHARRKDKSIPKMFENNNNSTEMTTDKRTQCSSKNYDGNCLRSTDKGNAEFDSVKSSDPSYQINYEYLTTKQQQNRISQSSNNQKCALAQCKSNNTISSCNNKCKNFYKTNIAVKIIQNCQELNRQWKRWSMPIILSQTSLILLCALMLLFGTSIVDAATKDGSK